MSEPTETRDPNPISAATPATPVPTEGTDGTVAKNAGRGGLAVAAAKLYFMVMGLIQQVLLTRVLGTAGYGALSTALSISSIAYNPIVSTSIQGVSRTVAQCDERERPSAIRRVLAIHATLALPIALIFFLFSGKLVAAIHAPHLQTPMRLLAFVLLFYGLYGPLIGIFNGQRRFTRQAGFDIAYATIRTGLMVLGGYLFIRASGSGVVGSVLGFVAASAIIALTAVSVTGIGRTGTHGPRWADYLRFLGPVFVGQILLNLLQQADLTVLRYFAASAALAVRLGPEQADPLVGAYRATQLFCFLPYQLLLSITFVLFPLLAKAHRDRSVDDVRLFVMTGIRLALIISGLMVSVLSGLSGPLLRLVFPPDVAPLATDAMQLLALGFGAFALFGILTTVLTSLKQEGKSAAITALAFALVVVLGVLLLRGSPFGADLLMRTAVATSIGLLAATLVASYFVHRAAGGVLQLSSLLRVLVSVAVIVTLGRLWSPSGKPMTLVAAVALALGHLALLIVLRELTGRDLAQLKSVFRGRAKTA